MKKILILTLALIMCLGCFAACTAKVEGATLAEAVEYLRSIYKDNAKETASDYDVVGKIVIGDTTFAVTWTTDNAAITVKESTKKGFYTIDLPAKNDAVVEYKLTATVADANGATETLTFDRALPVYDASAIVAKPEEGTAYKFYLVHAGLGQTLFANGETDNDKFLKSITDPKAAPDFFVEADGEGFKFYTTIGGAKKYLKASTTVSEDGKVSKYINYADEGSTWIYKSDVNGWFTTVDGVEYVVGTYGTYSTFSISESTYLTVENSGKTQFPAGLMLKDVAEAMTPSEGPTIYETPEEIVNAVYALDIGGILSAGHKYTLTGTITEIPSPYSADYGNITVIIVVGDMTDKPIECFRMKGEGIENLMVGDTITVSGELLKYDNKTETGKVEFNAGCTLDSGNFCNHTLETIPGKDATCTEAGLTEGQKCTTCGKTVTEQTEIEALGHEWGEVLSHDESEHWTACSRCDEKKDKAAHENGNDSVCDVCGYGCEHSDVNDATCGAPSTCNDCGAVLAPATGEHTYDDASDATCNGCDHVREILQNVVIFYPKENKYVTGIEDQYTSSSGNKKIQLKLTTNKAEAVALQVIRNADGTVAFMADGKYLYADGTHAEFRAEAGENTLFVFEETEGGIFIRCNTANYSGKSQYLEVYSDRLCSYGMGADPTIYVFELQNAEGAAGTVQEWSEGGSAGGDTPSTPSTDKLDAKTPEAGKAYKFAFLQPNAGAGIYYLTGEKSSYYMASTQTKTEGADFYVEATNGGFHLYCMVGGAKKYVNMVVNGTHVNGEFEDTATTVYTYDTTLKTLKAVVNEEDYIFGTKNDGSFTTLGPMKASLNPFYGQFILG